MWTGVRAHKQGHRSGNWATRQADNHGNSCASFHMKASVQENAACRSLKGQHQAVRQKRAAVLHIYRWARSTARQFQIKARRSKRNPSLSTLAETRRHLLTVKRYRHTGRHRIPYRTASTCALSSRQRQQPAPCRLPRPATTLRAHLIAPQAVDRQPPTAKASRLLGWMERGYPTALADACKPLLKITKIRTR